MTHTIRNLYIFIVFAPTLFVVAMLGKQATAFTNVADERAPMLFSTLSRLTTTNKSEGDNYHPAVSDDGSKVAFISTADLLNEGNIVENAAGLWIYDSSTVTFTHIVSSSSSSKSVHDIDISGNGEKVAFTWYSGLFNSGIVAPDPLLELWLYDTSTHTYDRIVSNSDRHIEIRNPLLNADGTKLFYVKFNRLQAAGDTLWMYDTVSSDHTIIIAADPDDYLTQVTINADGSKVAFQSETDFLNEGYSPHDNHLWLYDISLNTHTRIVVDIGTVTGGAQHFYPKMSADGSKIVFFCTIDILEDAIYADPSDNPNHVWLYDTTGATYTRISPTHVNGFLNQDEYHSPTISGDGKLISFYSDTTLSGYAYDKLWLRHTSAMTATVLTEAQDSDAAGYPVYGSFYSLSNQYSAINMDGTKLFFMKRKEETFIGSSSSSEVFNIWTADISDSMNAYLPMIVTSN